MPEVPLWQSWFVVPRRAVELFLAELEDDGISVAAFEEPAVSPEDPPWRIELTHRGKPDEDALGRHLVPLAERAGLGRIDVGVRPIPTTDWLARTAQSFPPQRVGRFWVHGSHVEAAPPGGAVPIRIDAGLAFGSGEHGTTQGCLLALDRLARRRRFRRVLDLGCGSGILAIAAAKCWAAQVLAADSDPQAVAVASANAADNGVGYRVRCRMSEGYGSAALRTGAPYDLILANILADPLCAMADDLARHLAPGGTAILSGLYGPQARRVIDAHRHARLRLRHRLDLDTWITLVMIKPRR
jgi:ribosomal protein L11 methyltransferase